MTPTRRKEARPLGRVSSMRRFVLLSLGVHVVALTGLSFPVPRPGQVRMTEPVYQVALVSWPEPNFQPPKPARGTPGASPTMEKPKPKPREKTPVPDRKKPEPVKTPGLAKPKPKPKAPATPPTADTAPEPARASPGPTTATSGPATPGPDSGDPVSLGMVDQPEFQHNYYLAGVRSALAGAWEPPTAGTDSLKVAVHLVILKDGTIQTPEIRVSSGWPVYDRAALRAVIGVKRLPPLPEGYAGDRLGLTVFFQSSKGTSP